MPIPIDGAVCFTVNEVADGLGISRQTFWRWRREGKVPIGRKYRDRLRIFTQAEIEQIREYANRVEPADPASRDQLKLFNGAA